MEKGNLKEGTTGSIENQFVYSLLYRPIIPWEVDREALFPTPGER